MNKKHVALIVVMVLLSIVLIIGGTYAFFLADIDNSKNEQMKVTSGEMILTFTDNDVINLPKAQPGDMKTKTFTVESKGSLATKYNLKFTDISNSFVDNEIYYTLKGDNGIDTKGYISNEYAPNGDFYIATNIPIGKSTDEDHLHTYTLTIEFISKNKPQNDNQEATFTSKINADSNSKAEVHVESLSTYCSDKPLSECMIENYDKFGKELIDDDPDVNIRYMGATPSNYIWFNCDDYSTPTEETCERWRIIGSFKNIEKVNADDTTTPQNLVKIVRNESIGNIAWDNKPKNTGTSVHNRGSNDWSDSRLMMLLNDGYSDDAGNLYGSEASLYWNSKAGKCYASEENQSIGLPTAIDCDFTTTGLKGNNNGPTKSLIENVIWHLGAIESTNEVDGSLNTFAKDVYGQEKSNQTCQSMEICDISRTTIWKGKVALLYASDYIYASAGSKTEGISRQECLNRQSNLFNKCTEEDWLHFSYDGIVETDEYPPGVRFLTPSLGTYASTATYVNNYNPVAVGSVFSSYVDYTDEIHPTLYLTHDTKITSGDGTYEKPYVIGVN